jgi:hypothetical protein
MPSTENKNSPENLWGILIGLITGSYIVFYLLKAFFFIRKNKQEV